MAERAPVTIVSAGIVSSVGLSLRATCAALRAKVDAFRETDYLDQEHEPIVGASIPSNVLYPEIGDHFQFGGEDKLERMFALAAANCVERLPGFDPSRTALFLLGPDASRPASSTDITSRRLARYGALFGMGTKGTKLHAQSRGWPIGSVGVVSALWASQELLASQAVDTVLIGGVDSLLSPADIHDALSNERVLTSDRSEGFIPGEAAACIAVRRASNEPTERPTLRVAGLGFANETQTLIANRPARGMGLMKAMQMALAAASLPAHAIHTRYSDVSGEAFFFEDASYAWTRLLREPSPKGYKCVMPAMTVGHVGCAIGPLMLGIALDAAARDRNRAPGRHSLLHFASSGSERGALIVSAV